MNCSCQYSKQYVTKYKQCNQNIGVARWSKDAGKLDDQCLGHPESSDISRARACCACNRWGMGGLFLFSFSFFLVLCLAYILLFPLSIPKYHKNPKNSDTWKNCCNHHKIWTTWLHRRIMCPTGSDGMANSVWVYTVCPDRSVRKLRIITVALVFLGDDMIVFRQLLTSEDNIRNQNYNLTVTYILWSLDFALYLAVASSQSMIYL